MNGFVKMRNFDHDVWYEFRNGKIDSYGLTADYRVIGNGSDTNFCGQGSFAWKSSKDPVFGDWYILELHFTS